MSRIGAETRQEQIKKWKDGVQKNIELLVAFTAEPLDDEPTEEFRSIVAGRILSLTNYLADGQWGLFDGQGLTPPPSKAEREAQEAAARAEAQEAAARAEAQEAAARAEAERTVDVQPLMLPEPTCVHFDRQDGCTHAENPHPEGTCDGCWKECAFYSLKANPEQTTEVNGEQADGAANEKPDTKRKGKRKGGKK